jgi:hypothetical protein
VRRLRTHVAGKHAYTPNKSARIKCARKAQRRIENNMTAFATHHMPLHSSPSVFYICPFSFGISSSTLVTHSLTHGAEPFLRSCQLCTYSRTSQHFMEPVGSLPCSQEPSTGPYPEPDQSNLYHPILSYLSKIHFNIVHPPTSWSS